MLTRMFLSNFAALFPLLEPSVRRGFSSKSHVALSDGNNGGVYGRQLQRVTDCEHDV